MSRRVLHRDIETRSTLDLTNVGAWRYASDPSTDVWCVAYAVDDDPVQLWIPGQPVPEEFHAAARDHWWIIAHNNAFERGIEEHILAPRYDWPIVPIERHACTMAMALANALPAKLETVAEVLDLPIRKDAQGARLMRLMSRPRKPRAGENPQGLYWHDDPQKLEQLYAYCRNDVEVERELFRRLPLLADSEQALWVLDATINQRGFHTDPVLEAASRIAAAAGQAVQEELKRITAGALTSTDQVAALLAWLAKHGCEVKNLRKPTLKHALRRKELDPICRRVIGLRLGAAHAAAAKIDTLLAWRDTDGRVRGTLRFHGAGTGRWTGHGPQPQNFKRDGEDIEAKLATVATGDLAHVAEHYPQPLEIVGDIARAMICAAPEHRLLIGDFSGIESRVLGWISGQQSKLDQWRKFDHTEDPQHEPYYILGRSCGQPEESARKIGKTADLAFGYMGGVGAWDKLAPEDDATSEQDKKRFQQTWRATHPQTAHFWYGIDRVAIAAVQKPNSTLTYKRLKFSYDGMYLRIVLPSGRALSYPFPRLATGKYGHPMVVFKDNAAGKFVDCRHGHGAYGGLWTENIVQAVSRDLLAAAMQRLEAAGYPVVLHVHDEIVAEVPINFGSVEEFQRLITTLPDWAEGLPIAAKIRDSERFSKSEKSAPAPHPNSNMNPGAEIPDDLSIPSFLLRGSPAPAAVELSAAPDELAAIVADDGDRPADHTDSDEDHAGNDQADHVDGGAAGQEDDKDGDDDEDPDAGANATDGSGGRWVTQKPKGWVKIPYRLPEILEALAKDPGIDVYLPEGEKDCETLVALGLIATTNSEGATPLKAKIGKWAPELNKWFYGIRHLFILADNDEVGRAFAQEKARALETIVPDIRIVPFPDVPEGEDVSYWLNELGHSKTELLGRCETAERWHDDGTLESVRADQVPMRAIHWLWSKRFAVGKIGIIAGLPDEGKGQILCYIAARGTGGLDWPNGEGVSPQGNVVILSAEENPSDSLVPRLEAAGADLSRIHFINMVRDRDEKTGHDRKRMFSLVSDLEKLRRKILELGDVIIVLIDPISAYLGIGKVDSYRDTDVRAALGPLKDLAEEMRVAVITVMHFNKKVDITNALLRVSNSMAFVGLPRHAYGVIADTENHRKLFVRAKNNDAAEADNQTLAFHFDARQVGTDPETSELIYAPFIVWEPGYVDVSASEAMQAASEHKSPGERDKAKNLLLGLLAEGREVFVDDLKDTAGGHGISWRTMRRAGDDLKVAVAKERTAKGKWFWKLPQRKD